MRASHRKRTARGAVFVEAIIVLSFFVIMFLGIVYFRSLYSEQMRAQRLARAGALANAMGACEGDAAAILGKETRDLTGNEEKGGGPRDTDYPRVQDQDSKSKASDVTGKMADGEGGAPLMKVTTLTMTGEARATTKRGVLAEEQGFRGTVGSKSFVACADRVTNDQYGGIAGKVTDVFGSLVGE